MDFKNGTNTFRTLIIGAGPAGTGPLVCAMQRGDLGNLLDTGICIIDRGSTMGHGSIGQYIINSDTFCDTFLECLQRTDDPVVQAISATDAKRHMDTYRGGAVPLQVVGSFMAEVGNALQSAIDSHAKSQFVPNVEARSIHRLPDGRFRVICRPTGYSDADQDFEIVADNVVTAMGASQSVERTLQSPIVPGVNLAGKYRHKVMLTNTVLATRGPAEIERRLQGIVRPRVLIIGASHSTTSTAWVLLNKVNITFGDGDITVLHREPFRIFYPSRDAALAEGYTDFTDDDFCPVTKRLYRLAGLRFDSRQLLKQIWGIGGAAPETRVRLIPLDRTGQHNAVNIEALLDESDLIVPAFGYRPNTLSLIDSDGIPIELLASGDGAPPLVDAACRVLDATGEVIPNLYGIGLASGFKLTGKLGGEPSFRGQTNGLWLYQNGVGELILDQILNSDVVPNPS